jgi:hypothetical protein
MNRLHGMYTYQLAIPVPNDLQTGRLFGSEIVKLIVERILGLSPIGLNEDILVSAVPYAVANDTGYAP